MRLNEYGIFEYSKNGHSLEALLAGLFLFPLCVLDRGRGTSPSKLKPISQYAERRCDFVPISSKVPILPECACMILNRPESRRGGASFTQCGLHSLTRGTRTRSTCYGPSLPPGIPLSRCDNKVAGSIDQRQKVGDLLGRNHFISP